MMVLLWILVIFIIWHLIGSIVLTIIDHDKKLNNWADKAPLGLDIFIPSAWPIILWFWFITQKRVKP